MERDLFFRREAGRLVSALTRIFGVHNVALAEDVVQDALCRAVAEWPFSGVPENPSAWLMKVAKNRALDVLRDGRTPNVSLRISATCSKANGRSHRRWPTSSSRAPSRTASFA